MDLTQELQQVMLEIKGQLDSGRNLSSRMEDLDRTYVEVKGALEAQQKALEDMAANQRQNAPRQPVRMISAAEAIAEQAVNHQGFRNLIERKGDNVRNAGMVTDFSSPFEYKAAVGDADYGYNATSTQLSDIRRIVGVNNEQRIDREDQRELCLWDIIPKVNDPSQVYQWPAEASRTKDAQGVMEGAEKPNSAFSLTTNTSQATTVATHLTVSRQLLTDIAEMKEFIRDVLMDATLQHLEDELVLGGGDWTQGELQGLLDSGSGILTQAFSSNVYDSARAGLKKLRKDYRSAPTHLVVNHDDHFNMDTLKADDGHYLWIDSGRASLGGPVDTLWRVPVVPCNSMVSGYGLMGNFNLGTQIRMVENMKLLMSYENDVNFTHNKVTVMVECRLHFIVKRPRRFVKIGLISGY